MATSVSVATVTVNTTWYQILNVIQFVQEILDTHVVDCGETKYIEQVRVLEYMKSKGR